MRMSQLVGMRYKERPAEATIESHALLLRGGYARQVANGIYSLLPPGLRVVRKIERIIREEMDRIGGQEVLMPLIQPRELWDESGRYASVGSELVRFKDRTGHDMVLAMTHEEGVVHLCRNEINSHSQLPFMVYQIQTKFRDEPRSRGGLIRVREFTMKDAYSFHTSQEDLEQYYEVCYKAYDRIFARAGLPEVVAVASDSGMMGGKVAHEFILLTEIGEDTIVTSDGSDYRANLEVAEGIVAAYPEDPKSLEKVHTPGKKTIEDVAAFLGVPTHQTAKVVFYESDSEGKPVLALIRGDRDVSDVKLAKIIKNMPVAAQDSLIKANGAEPGFATPMGLDATKWRIVIDHTVRDSNNLVTGANEVDYHFRNFNLDRDFPGHQTVDICVAQPGDGSPDGKGKLVFQRGIEVGNIFQLGSKYSTSMGMLYNDEQGKSCVPIMGCYGIGVGRLMSSIMEVHRDQYGPKWPMSVAPWHVHLNAIKLNVKTVSEMSEKLYSDLLANGLEVVYDDRDARPGVQFADADLLGVPIRLVVSERNLANGQIEWKRRDTGETGTLSVDEVVAVVKQWVAESVARIDAIADTK